MLSNFPIDKTQPTTRDIREANRLQILHQLLLRKTSTRQELTQLTGLSNATVANLIAGMMEEGLVVETGTVASQGGRPTAILAVNASAGACVGVDVAETYIRFELYDLTLQNLAEYEIELPSTKKEPQEVVNMIVSGFNMLLGKVGLPRDQVVGVGISIPGPFEHSTGVSVFAPSWGWQDVPLQSMLEKELNLPLYMDNPLKFNALAEAWFGAGRGAETMAAVVLGTGVGVGLVINGQLFRGASNTAGEWGHSVIVAGGRTCRCGNQGCLEAYVGAPGIIQTLTEIDPKSPLLFPEDQTRTISAIATAAEEGDTTAKEVIHQTAVYLSAGLSSLINILNPEQVILGSWVTGALGSVMLPELLELVEKQSLAQPFKSVQFTLSKMKRNPVSVGAATLVLEEFLASTGRQAVAVRSEGFPAAKT
ncbi:ROK family transcriptional regulator [Candidatus Villigracilis saccharophilus]|uniref:ROK family transcriptional regulator n=1 Tax=Candidatus Villigracilis saccharophilus TaxID=3140684 RepID=UPI003136610D|nr:ROK family transcriptional regulator [Anaerolineales bacterium]